MKQCRQLIFDIRYYTPPFAPGYICVTLPESHKELRFGVDIRWNHRAGRSTLTEITLSFYGQIGEARDWFLALGFVDSIPVPVADIPFPSPRFGEPGFDVVRQEAWRLLHAPAGNRSAPDALTYRHALEIRPNPNSPLLQRYLSGAEREVWEEITALGERARDPEHLPHVMAVVNATMSRVRINCELLHRRLRRMGYRFREPHRALVRPDRDVLTQIEKAERDFGALPLALCAFWHLVGCVDFEGMTPQQLQDLPPWRQDRSPAPFTLWSNRFGLATFRVDAVRSQIGQYPDPLCLLGAEMLREAEWEWGTVEIVISPDYHMKEGVSGNTYVIRLNDACIDPPLLREPHRATLIGYLRLAFAAGGFPGAAEMPGDLLLSLAEGLLPI